MTDPGAIHDLLERAVHEHRPAVADPTRAVLARARRDRRRAALTGLAVALIVVLGAGGLLGVLDPDALGTSPATGGGGRAAMWTAGQPDDALGRDEAAARAEAEAAARAEGEMLVENAALAAARAAAEAGTLSVTRTVSSAVRVPNGWTTLSGDDGSDLEGLRCLDANTVYRVTIGGVGPDQPCLGEPTPPYLWDTTGMLPRLTTEVEQTVLADGTPRWIQTASTPGGSELTDVYYPTSSQHVQAGGVDMDTLLTLVQPGGSPADSPLLPPSTQHLTLWMSSGTNGARPLPTAAADEVLATLRDLPTLNAGGCFGDHPGPSGHWQLELRSAFTPLGFLLVDAPAEGCRAAASSYGGVGQVSDPLVALLATLD